MQARDPVRSYRLFRRSLIKIPSTFRIRQPRVMIATPFRLGPMGPNQSSAFPTCTDPVQAPVATREAPITAGAFNWR